MIYLTTKKTMKKFNQTLTDILKKDLRFVDQDGDLLKSAVVDKAWKVDHALIELLLTDKEVRENFFDKVKDALVFNITKFVDFIQDKNFLNDSWTKYRNKVGLNIKDKFLKERGEISLVFPYKDCILEGGMNDEEAGRKEIFFNEILAQDEIDRLLDPKVLTGWKRFSEKGEEKVKEIKRDKNGLIKENLIIKGNNLLALHSLKKQFSGKVKLIYIDPPYNTGNDGFRYNDNFNHSTWLTFMKNRLEVARELLREDGVIFVQCDDNEQAYLTVLMDEVFGRENLVNTICIKMSHLSGVKMSHNNKKIPKIKEFVLFYGKNRGNISINIPSTPSNWKNVLDRYTQFLVVDEKDRDNETKWSVIPLNEAFKKNQISKEQDKEKFCLKNCGRIFRTARNNSEQFKNLKDDNFIRLVSPTGLHKIAYKKEEILFASSKIDKNKGFVETLGDIWTDIGINNLHNEGGISLKEGKKPEKIIERLLEIATKENDIVLDYHLGSGTTCAVAHKMNRQYIGIEQMSYIEDLAVKRLQNVVNGDQSGISKSVEWKGGGDFIYCELAKWNESFVEKIRDAKDTTELLRIWEEMKNPHKSFLNYNVDLKQQDEAMDEFKELSLEKQKEVLVMLLDKNQLYVNLSEIDDADYKISDEDKANSNNFYNTQL